MDIAFTTIGRAVLAAQRLELALVPIFELYRIHDEPGRLEATGGKLSPGAFKQPIANMLNQLVARSRISPALDSRFRRYVEDRHLLIHRWILEKGFPDEKQDWADLAKFGLKVEAEANKLTLLLAEYVLRYGDPETSTCTIEEFGTRMSELFLTLGTE